MRKAYGPDRESVDRQQIRTDRLFSFAQVITALAALDYGVAIAICGLHFGSSLRCSALGLILLRFHLKHPE